MEPGPREPRRPGGQPEAEAFSRALSELEGSGLAVLVVGSVPDPVAAAVARRLLGRGPDRRCRVLSVVGANEGRERRLLPADARTDPDHLRVIRCDRTVRGETRSREREGREYRSRTVETDAGVLGEAIAEAARELKRTAEDLRPGDLRVWVDALSVLFEDHDREAALGFVHLLSALVRKLDGRVHYRLRAPPDDERVRTLASLCEATVRLRLRERPEMCWHLDGGETSGWIPVEWDGVRP